MGKKKTTVDTLNLPPGVSRVFIPDGEGGSVEAPVVNGQVQVPAEITALMLGAGFVLAAETETGDSDQ